MQISYNDGQIITPFAGIISWPAPDIVKVRVPPDLQNRQLYCYVVINYSPNIFTGQLALYLNGQPQGTLPISGGSTAPSSGPIIANVAQGGGSDYTNGIQLQIPDNVVNVAPVVLQPFEFQASIDEIRLSILSATYPASCQGLAYLGILSQAQ